VIEEADALHARVRSAIAGEPFAYEELAQAIASFQARHHAGYARLCRARGVDPAKDPPSALPAVPTDAFRVTRVATFPAELETAVFRTSGTTVGTRGAHAMRTLATYHDASIAFARATLFAPYASRPTIVAVAPSLEEAPDSSLGRMLAWFVDELGAPGSRFVSPTAVDEALSLLSSVKGPVVLLATAFAHVFLLDRLAGRTIPLAPGSRAMQTGGFKGRSREVAADVLRAQIAQAYAIDEGDVVGEYGMTELTSQLWATREVGSTRDRWIYAAPPWVRVRACDPVTLAARPAGERGIARIEDLANVESAWAIQTADEVVVDEAGRVELFGRLAGATPRGCSLAIEELGG
jgi:hypothetical protein